MVLRAGADALRATYWQIDGAQTPISYYGNPLSALKQMKPTSFHVQGGVLTPGAG